PVWVLRSPAYASEIAVRFAGTGCATPVPGRCRMRRRFLFACCLLGPSAAALALVACGGGGGAITSLEGWNDVGDVTVADVATDSQTGADTNPPPRDAGADGACVNLGSPAACDTCCKAAHREGAAVLGQALLSCGCAPQNCGPTDAAVPDADAAAL